jgi:hypothetical protein
VVVSLAPPGSLRADERFSQPHQHIHRPHSCSPRRIQDGQYIHESVLNVGQAEGHEYIPIAQWSEEKEWTRAAMKDKVEHDPYTSVTEVFDKLKAKDYQVANLSVLTTFTSSGECTVRFPYLQHATRTQYTETGKRLIIDVPEAFKILFDTLEAMQSHDIHERTEIIALLVQVLSVFAAESAKTKRYANSELRNLLSEVIDHRPDMQTFISRVMGSFGNGELSSIALMI